MFSYDLKTHLLKHPHCKSKVDTAFDSPSSSSRPSPSADSYCLSTQYTDMPPDVFGTPAFFDFCSNVRLESNFPVAMWHGIVSNHVTKFNALIRHSVPIVWRDETNHCDGLKLPRLSNPQHQSNTDSSEFKQFVEMLLTEENLLDKDLEIIVKSAKIGQVSNISPNVTGKSFVPNLDFFS